jgi:hypothetical protein
MKIKLSARSAAQRTRLLDWLQKKGSITTLEARSHLDILMPAARIYELRHNEYYNIQLYWVDDLTDAGVRHKVGKYVLQSGQWQPPKGLVAE